MDFLHSKHAKLLLIAFFVLLALVLGVTKQLSDRGIEIPNTPKEQQTEQNKPTDPALQALEQPSQNQNQAVKKDEKVIEQEVNEIIEQAGIEATPNTVEDIKSLKMGLSSYEKTNLQGAIINLSKAINSEDVKVQKVALRNLGDCYMQLNEPKDIEETYTKLVEIEDDPEIKKEAYDRLGETYRYTGEDEKAAKAYKESYKLEPTLERALKLCEAYDKIHNSESLVEIVEDYMSRDPGNRPLFEKYSAHLSGSRVWNTGMASQEEYPPEQPMPEPQY